MTKAILFLGASLFAMAEPALAQNASEEDSIPEIVVSAQRRTERLQDVPVSVTALGADTLRSRNVNDLSQVALAAPSLQVGNDNTFAVRGVGTQAFATTIDSSVATSLDDVNLGRPFLAQGLFNDVERVEVLNGPQGLLFGKNASAGLLNVVSTRPKLGVFGIDTNAELSNRETPGSDTDSWSMIARGTVNVPIGDDGALRVTGIYSYEEPSTTFVGRRDVRNDADREQYGVRAKYLQQLTPSLELYVIGEYAESHGVAGIYDRTYRQLGAGSVNVGPLAASGITPGDKNFTYAGDGGFWRDLKLGGAQASLSWTSPGGVVVSNIAAWKFYNFDSQLDVDFTNSNGANINRSHADYDQFSNELRVALPSENRLSGQAGLYYFHSTIKQEGQIAGNNYLPGFLLPAFPFCVGAVAVPGASPPACSTSNNFFLGRDNAYSMKTDSYAAFGQLTFSLTDAFKVFAGGRVTRDEIAIDLVQIQDAYFVPLGVPGSFAQSYGHTDFSWRVGGQYQVTPDAMLYGSYGRGYKGPGFNDTAATTDANLLVRSEKSNTAEIGLKTSWFNRRLIFNVSAFHTKFNNYQTQSLDTALQAFVVQNAASVTSKGVEVTVGATPLHGLSINGSATFLDSKFGDFAGAECYPGQTGCTGGSFNARGLRTPTAPKFASSLQAMYEMDTGGAAHPFIEANWYHRTAINYLINRAPGARVPTTDLIGASAGVRLDNGIRIAIFCKNCTNEYNPNFIGLDAGDASQGVASYQQQFGFDSARTIGANVQFRF
ncbi:TonB-dependent receptor (plasmid) [Novosphingobium resinovorum]|uniref:TonB-dependent receptor n=1 Tax=Novosphingobium TaxID=165696 RepID=UPI001B3C76CA|nr:MULTISPECIES: TonB-dependent receptor [Novosphingobium]MBF7015310.1 TonB-dependent receptor [Novosphingobium sp. HR1a]WJM29989.1 TonB-dependent receptor [Novosphingobium resinovorum]